MSGCSRRCGCSTIGRTRSRARWPPGKSKTLGVVSFDTTLYGPASTLFGIERAAHRGGLLHQHRQPPLARPQRRARRGRAAPRAGRRRDPRDRTADRATHAPCRSCRDDLPVVAVEAGPDQGVPVASVDQFAGAALATQHLLDLGSSHGLAHRRAGRLAGGAAARRGLAVDARGGRRAGAARAGRRLEREVGLRARPAARGRSRGDGGVRRQRPDGAGAPPCPARGRPRAAGVV